MRDGPEVGAVLSVAALAFVLWPAALARAEPPATTAAGFDVQVDFPSGGERLAGGKTVRWSVRDPDGARPTYEVEYSTDAGATWASRARGLRKAALVLDFDQLAGCDPHRCLVRVRASDGKREAVATSGPFTVAKKKPKVRIVLPADGEVLEQRAPTRFRGWGEDPEDGALRGGALVWTSDLDGALGTGESLILTDLSPGLHVITLAGTDTDRNLASATIRVTVERRGPMSARPEQDD